MLNRLINRVVNPHVTLISTRAATVGRNLGAYNISNDDNNYGVENVSLEVNMRCFKIHRSYFMSFNLSNVGDIFWS